MTTIAIHRTQDGVLTSATSATLTITNSAGTVVLASQPVTPFSAGIYSYTTTTLPAGTYTATWVFLVTGQPNDTVARIFQVETPVSSVRGVTLAEIERGIAARVGPYYRHRARSGSGPSSLLVSKLQSSVDAGDYEDLFLLRRARDSSDALIANFNTDDRQRIVASFTATSGLLVPDNAWTIAPVENEMVEFHYLDPDQQLREAAVAGLRRCFFEETLEITATTYLREVNLTSSAHWITRPGQIRRVQYGRQSFNPVKAPWFESFQQGSDVWVRTAIPNVGTVRVTALRPHFTFVNGEDSFVGPNHDDDVLAVDPLYAWRAGHISAWELFPSRLSPIAAQGLAVTMKAAADAFTLASMAYIRPEPEILQNKFGQDDVIDWLQVGNL
jgi:hypothetical protein